MVLSFLLSWWNRDRFVLGIEGNIRNKFEVIKLIIILF